MPTALEALQTQAQLVSAASAEVHASSQATLSDAQRLTKSVLERLIAVRDGEPGYEQNVAEMKAKLVEMEGQPS